MDLAAYPARQDPDAGGRSPLLAAAACIRYREIIVLQGPPLMGMAFAAGPWSLQRVPAVALFTAAGLLLVAHIWTLNDWADLRRDQSDPRRPAAALATDGRGSRALLHLSLLMLAGSLGVFTLLPVRTILIAAAIAAIGAGYSLGPIFAKGTPVLSSVLHFAGGMLHFLLGYTLFSPTLTKGLLLAPFFALVFTSGHATQEVQDWWFDHVGRIRTNAVRFGAAPVFVSACAGFAAAYAYAAALIMLGFIPAGLIWPLAAAAALHAFSAVSAWKSGLSAKSVKGLRSSYRILFAAVGACWLCILLR